MADMLAQSFNSQLSERCHLRPIPKPIPVRETGCNQTKVLKLGT